MNILFFFHLCTFTNTQARVYIRTHTLICLKRLTKSNITNNNNIFCVSNKYHFIFFFLVVFRMHRKKTTDLLQASHNSPNVFFFVRLSHCIIQERLNI